MKTRNIAMWTLAASLVLAGCDKGEELETALDNAKHEQQTVAGDVPAGYFRATFSPGGTTGGAMTRAEVNGQSTQVQTLAYIIYKNDGKGYKYQTEGTVLEYKQDIQTYTWPLKDVKITLPNGSYKVVFIGNTAPQLFGQTEAVLSNYRTDYADARLSMPQGGPKAFTETNMYYLATADFSNEYPDVEILLQRVVSQSAYSRDFVDTNKALTNLTNSLVMQIQRQHLTEDIVRGLLTNALTKPVDKALGNILSGLLGGTAAVVDRLVDALLGDVLESLNEQLLEKVLEAVQNSALGQGDVLGKVLNPWTNAETATITANIPASIDFDRTTRSYMSMPTENGANLIPLQGEYDGIRHFELTTLNGKLTLQSAEVNKEGILGSLLEDLDGDELGGLLIDLKTPLAYTQKTNVRYTTNYDFLNLKLGDMKSEESISLNISLDGILDTDTLLKALLGDNPLTGGIGKLIDSVIDPLLSTINGLVIKPLDISLPNLSINNISVDGRWGKTQASNGELVKNETGENITGYEN